MKQFKLINNKTKEETICSLVTIDGYDYYVSDDYARFNSYITDGKEVEQVTYRDMVTGDYSIKPNGRTPMAQHRPIMEWETIIATNNPNIDIAKVIDEVEESFKDKSNIPYFPGDLKETCNWWYKEGHNKAKETHKYTEEDLVNFAVFCSDNHTLDDSDKSNICWQPLFKDFQKQSSKELLDIWKEQRIKTIYYE